MNNKITMFDYNADWVLKDYSIDNPGGDGFLSREELIRFFGTLGVDGVEIMHAYWGDMPAAEVKKLTDDAGLPILNYIIFVDLVMPDAGERRAAVDQARSLLDRAAELGAKLSMIVPAVVKEGVPLAGQRGWLIEGLRQCAEHAAPLGITQVCENLDYPPARPLLGTGKDCHDVCRDVDHPNFRLIFDTCASLFVEEHPLTTLEAMGSYAIHVHLKSSRPLLPGEKATRWRETVSGKQLTGAVLDGGLVEIPPILTELEKRGYEDYLLVEYQGENDPRPALQYNVEYVRRQLGI